jgi:chromosomal replication initiation ATPase DnaA
MQLAQHSVRRPHNPRSAAARPSRTEIAEDAEIVEQVVLRTFGLPERTLRGPLRGRAAVAFARQVAIYVLHIHLGLSLTRSARAFGRDRTTAAHACRIVEDRRDDGRIDRLVASVETALARWSAARDGGLGRGAEDRLQ